jgi:hypothetical protein
VPKQKRDTSEEKKIKKRLNEHFKKYEQQYIKAK